jgi:hypothetical protein
MAAGYVRVAITTNFDRLLEKAAEAAGITPALISTADSANGALPLTHSKATIIKVNGDYLDTRIRNTSEELSEYEPQIAALLDRGAGRIRIIGVRLVGGLGPGASRCN